MTNPLEAQFKQAFASISAIEETLAPDVMLKLYAYYKQASQGDHASATKQHTVRDGFKLNAWSQLAGMSQENAMKEYIQLANSILTNKL